MTSITKDVVQHYLFLKPYRFWNDSMRRAVIYAKYKESQKWAKSS